MGDTPSVAWLLKGCMDDPIKPSWGGSYVRAWERPFLQLDRMPTKEDRIEMFGVLELRLPVSNPSHQAKVFLKVENQRLIGHLAGNGTMRFRFCPKAAKQYTFTIESNIRAIDGQTGAVTAYAPSSEVANKPSVRLPNWWTDDLSPHLAEGSHNGAKTVSRWREEFLQDFAERMKLCESTRP